MWNLFLFDINEKSACWVGKVHLFSRKIHLFWKSSWANHHFFFFCTTTVNFFFKVICLKCASFSFHLFCFSVSKMSSFLSPPPFPLSSPLCIVCLRVLPCLSAHVYGVYARVHVFVTVALFQDKLCWWHRFAYYRNRVYIFRDETHMHLCFRQMKLQNKE